MGQALGTGDKKSVNVELNVVPFIDLLSCITVFLMLSVIWISIARLDVKPAGRAAGEPCTDGTCDKPRLSVLIDADEIWVGVSRVNDFQKIASTPAGYDWAALESALKLQKASAYFESETEIEIAAESTPGRPITYQALIAAMDVAVKVGFVDVGVTEPHGLSARPGT